MLEFIVVIAMFGGFVGSVILIAKWIVKHKIDKGVKGWS